jgi:hypothetical protein
VTASLTLNNVLLNPIRPTAAIFLLFEEAEEISAIPGTANQKGQTAGDLADKTQKKAKPKNPCPRRSI